MPSPGLPTLFVAAHLTAWARRWAPTLALLAGALLEVAALLLPVQGLGVVGVVVLLAALLGHREPRATPDPDSEPSQIQPPVGG